MNRCTSASRAPSSRSSCQRANSAARSSVAGGRGMDVLARTEVVASTDGILAALLHLLPHHAGAKPGDPHTHYPARPKVFIDSGGGRSGQRATLYAVWKASV